MRMLINDMVRLRDDHRIVGRVRSVGPLTADVEWLYWAGPTHPLRTEIEIVGRYDNEQ
jgi:hypothetical protein